MPQENSETAKRVIKTGLLRDLGSLMAICMLTAEAAWFHKYYSGTIEWFQIPLPDYETVMAGIHLYRIVFCLICLVGFFKPMRALWEVFKYGVFVYQCIIVSLTTVYWVKYGYTLGSGIGDALMALSGVPLLIAFFLMIVKKDGINRIFLGVMVVLDLLIYFLGSFFYTEIDAFNVFFPYHGFLLKSVLAAIFVTFICCYGNLGDD